MPISWWGSKLPYVWWLERDSMPHVNFIASPIATGFIESSDTTVELIWWCNHLGQSISLQGDGDPSYFWTHSLNYTKWDWTRWSQECDWHVRQMKANMQLCGTLSNPLVESERLGHFPAKQNSLGLSLVCLINYWLWAKSMRPDNPPTPWLGTIE